MRLLVAPLFLGLVLTSGPAGAGFETPETPSQEVGRQEPPFRPRPWDLSLHAFFGYNSNVQKEVDDDPFFMGDTDSKYFGLTADGVYRFYQTPVWTAGAGLRLDQTVYLEDQDDSVMGPTDDQSDYNLTVINPSLFVNRAIMVAGRPGTVGGSYSLRYEDAKVEAVDNLSHSFSLNSGVRVAPDWEVGAAGTLSWTDFEVEFPDENQDGRDSFYHRTELNVTKHLLRATSLKGSVAYAKNHADGRNFDYDGWSFNGTFRTWVYGPLWSELTAGYDMRDYRGFQSGFTAPPGREEQDIYSVNLTLYWVFGPNWIADAYAGYSRYDSNSSEFESDQTNVGVGLTYKF